MAAMRSPADLTVFVTGSFGFMDIGDEAMLTEDLSFLTEQVGFSRDRISLLGGDPDYIAWYHQHPAHRCFSSRIATRAFLETERSGMARLRSGFRDLLRGDRKWTRSEKLQREQLLAEVDRADALLVTGGGTINTRDREGSSLRRLNVLIRLFRDRGVPTFLSGQTIGPLGLYPDHDEMAREIVASADVLTTRDEYYSKRYLDMIDARPREHLTVLDDAAALGYEGAPLTEEVETFLDRGPAAALNITEYTGYTTEKQVFVSRIAEHLVTAHDLQVVLVSHTNLDYTHLHLVWDMLPVKTRDRVLLPDTRLWHDRSLKRLISRCQVAIGGRYHFVVFAATSDTPFVGMCGNHYSYIKQDGFARQLGLSNSVLTERETWELECVIERIGWAMRQKLDIKAHLPRPSVSMRRLETWLEELAR